MTLIGDQDREQSDQGFTGSDISLEQAMHRDFREQGILDIVESIFLACGEGEVEVIDQSLDDILWRMGGQFEIGVFFFGLKEIFFEGNIHFELEEFIIFKSKNGLLEEGIIFWEVDLGKSDCFGKKFMFLDEIIGQGFGDIGGFEGIIHHLSEGGLRDSFGQSIDGNNA